jgi:hypothetical protein
MALVIEAIEPGLPGLSVAHYGEQNGDLMRDPEMCFELSQPIRSKLSLDPYYWRNDYVAVEQWSRNLIKGHYLALFVLLILKEAPFDKRDAQLVPAAGSCVDCPKRTGQNKLLVSELSMQDACTDPTCYQAKVDVHVAKTIAAKPKLVQISTAYGKPQEGSVMLPRNKYTEIRPEKPTAKGEATRPEYKTCRFTTEAIVSDGKDKGELRKVCTQANCPVHHPKSTRSRLRRMLSGRPSRKSSARKLRLPIRLVSASLPPSPQPYRCG